MKEITDYIVETTQLPILDEQNDNSKKGYKMFNTGGVEAEVGEFFYALVRLCKPNVVVETGTHYGISDAYLALGLKKNGYGKLYTCDPTDYCQARELFSKLDINGYIDYRINRSLVDETFSGVDKIDILFLDSEPKFRFEEFDKYISRVNPGGFILIHDLDQKLSYGHYQDGQFCWPYGSFKDVIGKRLKSGEIQSVSFPTPRGLTLFQKTDSTFNSTNFLVRKNMNRGVLLPSVGDPFILNNWMKNFKKWQDLVDNVYVNLDYDPKTVTDEVIELNRKILKHPKVKIYEKSVLDHGPSLRFLHKEMDDDVVLFTEEDFSVTSKILLGGYLNAIEDRRDSVISTGRGCCSVPIADALQDRLGTVEANTSPCFCITRRDIIEKTDLIFEAKSWGAGETIPYIKYIVPEQTNPDDYLCGDTFVHFSLQLRELGIPITLFTKEYYHSLYHHDVEGLKNPLKYVGIHWGSMSCFRKIAMFRPECNFEEIKHVFSAVNHESYRHEIFRRFVLYHAFLEKSAIEYQETQTYINALTNLSRIHEWFKANSTEWNTSKDYLESLRPIYRKVS